MALLVKRSDMAASLSSQTPTPENQIDGVAGEAIDYGDACYLGPDGLFYRCVGTSPASTALVHGFAANAQRANKPITLYRNAYFGYTAEADSTTAVPGTLYYVDGTTPGALNTTVNGHACAVGALFGNIIVTTTWDKV